MFTPLTPSLVPSLDGFWGKSFVPERSRFRSTDNWWCRSVSGVGGGMDSEEGLGSKS